MTLHIVQTRSSAPLKKLSRPIDCGPFPIDLRFCLLSRSRIMAPLHPLISRRLIPEYVRFHVEHLDNILKPDYSASWDPLSHLSLISKADGQAVDVGRTGIIEVKKGLLARFYDPRESTDKISLPVLV